jgi:hypothetical protein
VGIVGSIKELEHIFSVSFSRGKISALGRLAAQITTHAAIYLGRVKTLGKST